MSAAQRFETANVQRLQRCTRFLGTDMSRTVGDFFWERMSQWGVRTIFGYPGDGINGLLGALNRAGVGDGAMQMNNMAELITVAKYWKRWASPRWGCAVWNNEDLKQGTGGQRGMAGGAKIFGGPKSPPFGVSQNFGVVGGEGE